MQRLGSLWDEAIIDVSPKIQPSPEFHLHYFLHREGIRRLKNWLTKPNPGPNCEPEKKEDTYFVNITPDWLKEKLQVVKAVSFSKIPLTFGHGNPRIRITDFWRGIHPVA